MLVIKSIYLKAISIKKRVQEDSLNYARCNMLDIVPLKREKRKLLSLIIATQFTKKELFCSFETKITKTQKLQNK